MGLKRAYKKVFGSRTIGQAAAVTAKQIAKPYRAVYGSRSVPEALATTAREVARVKAGMMDIAEKLNVERHSVEVALDEDDETIAGGMLVDGESDRGYLTSTKVANTKGRITFAQTKLNGAWSPSLSFKTANVDNALSGMEVVDITPSIDSASLGSQHTRRGNQVKLTGLHVDLRVNLPKLYNDQNVLGYTNNYSRITFLNGGWGKMYIIKTQCNDATPAMVRRDFLNPGEDSGVVDYSSTRNWDNKADYEILCVKRFRIKPAATKGHDLFDVAVAGEGATGAVLDTVQPSAMAVTQYQAHRSDTVVRKNLKLGQRLRWHQPGDIQPFNCKYFAVFVLDRGNSGTLTPSLHTEAGKPFRDLQYPLAQSSVEVRGVFKWWFVDN